MAAEAQALPEYLETSDVARELDLSYSGVRVVVGNRRLLPVGITRRGVKLFSADDVEKLRQARLSQREARG